MNPCNALAIYLLGISFVSYLLSLSSLLKYTCTIIYLSCLVFALVLMIIGMYLQSAQDIMMEDLSLTRFEHRTPTYIIHVKNPDDTNAIGVSI